MSGYTFIEIDDKLADATVLFIRRLYNQMMYKGEKPEDFEIYLPISNYFNFLRYLENSSMQNVLEAYTEGRIGPYMGFTIINGFQMSPSLPYVKKVKKVPVTSA